MFDVNLLDRMNFGELAKTLDHLREEMRQLHEDGAAGEDDPRHDMLLVIANQVIVRMDSIVGDNVVEPPELHAQWKRQTEEFRRTFKDYARTYLKDGVPLLTVGPDNSSRAGGEDAAWRAKVDAIVLDEKLLDGMNARDLFDLNHYITEKVKEIDERLPDNDDETDPIIKKLLDFGTLVIRRLDPLVRDAYKNVPEKLAGWEAIMDDYKDLDDEGEEEAGADVESSAVS